MITVEGITIAPVLPSVKEPVKDTKEPPKRELSSLSLRDMNKLPVTRTNATQTLNPLMHQQATQYSPAVINKATDSNDLIRSVHKMSMTEVAQTRDQMAHTGDLIKVLQIGTNTPPPVVPLTRSTASNTTTLLVKSVGTNSDATIEHVQNQSGSLSVNNSSKIPRPSPSAQRKFARQDTFTVAKQSEEAKMKECPAEALLK